MDVKNCVFFDHSQGLQGDVYDVEEQRLRMAAYDPNYFLPFALHGLSVGCIDAEEFVRLGILAVAMASLSSSNEDMRKLGYEVLAKYLTVLVVCVFFDYVVEIQTIVHHRFNLLDLFEPLRHKFCFNCLF